MTQAPAQPTHGTVDPSTQVADLVSAVPARAAVFERFGIDYCCGGKVSLSDTCSTLGLDLDDMLMQLDAAGAHAVSEPDWTHASVAELIGNIVDVHHAYLRDEMPRVTHLAAKVAGAHGATNPRLVEAREQVDLLVTELRAHLDSEEVDVFPRCIQVEAGEEVDVADLILQLEHEHDAVAGHLTRVRELLDDYTVPAGACTSYRAYLDTMQRMEADIHRHVHKENHVLFGKVMDLIAAGQEVQA